MVCFPKYEFYEIRLLNIRLILDFGYFFFDNMWYSMFNV